MSILYCSFCQSYILSFACQFILLLLYILYSITAVVFSHWSHLQMLLLHDNIYLHAFQVLHAVRQNLHSFNVKIVVFLLKDKFIKMKTQRWAKEDQKAPADIRNSPRDLMFTLDIACGLNYNLIFLQLKEKMAFGKCIKTVYDIERLFPRSWLEPNTVFYLELLHQFIFVSQSCTIILFSLTTYLYTNKVNNLL